jgi:type IV pilus assembly protein PilA
MVRQKEGYGSRQVLMVVVPLGRGQGRMNRQKHGVASDHREQGRGLQPNPEGRQRTRVIQNILYIRTFLESSSRFLLYRPLTGGMIDLWARRAPIRFLSQRTIMTTLKSRLQLSLLSRKKGRNLLEKGFTLVELMIVIVIVGILSAVALPNFLGQTAKAKATECTTKGGNIMGQVAAEALQSEAAGNAAITSLVTSANNNSDLCTFTSGGAAADNIYKLTVTGKTGSDLADKFDGAFCVDYATGKKGATTSNTGTAPTAPDCTTA